MAGRIPIDLRRNPQQKNARPQAVGSNFGIEPLMAQARQGAAISQLGGQFMDVATQYAAENKQADERADALGFRTQLKSIQTDAAQRASETDDPEQIRQIWEEAHGQVGEFIGGKSEKGVPNIRWGNQRKDMYGAADALLTDFQTTAEVRIAQVGKQNSNAKANQAQRDAEMSGDREQIIDAVRVRTENGTLTTEQAEVERRAAFTRSDHVLAKNNILSIETMEPDAAAEAAETFEQAMTVKEKGDWVAFENIVGPDRKILVKQAKAAALTSRRMAEQAEQAATREQSDSFVKWQLDNPGSVPTVALGREQGWDDVVLLKLQGAHAKAEAAAKKPGLENDAARDLYQKVRAYNPGQDKDGAQALEISLGIAELPDAKRGFIKEAFKAKHQTADQPVNDVKALQSKITDELMDLVAESGFNGKNEVSGGRYKKTKTKKGEKVGEFYGEAAVAAGQVQSLVDSYVKRINPSVDELADWYNTNPSIQTLRKDLELKNFLGRIPSMLEAAGPSAAKPGLVDTLNAQAGGGTTDNFDYLKTYLEK